MGEQIVDVPTEALIFACPEEDQTRIAVGVDRVNRGVRDCWQKDLAATSLTTHDRSQDLPGGSPMNNHFQALQLCCRIHMVGISQSLPELKTLLYRDKTVTSTEALRGIQRLAVSEYSENDARCELDALARMTQSKFSHVESSSVDIQIDQEISNKPENQEATTSDRVKEIYQRSKDNPNQVTHLYGELTEIFERFAPGEPERVYAGLALNRIAYQDCGVLNCPLVEIVTNSEVPSQGTCSTGNENNAVVQEIEQILAGDNHQLKVHVAKVCAQLAADRHPFADSVSDTLRQCSRQEDAEVWRWAYTALAYSTLRDPEQGKGILDELWKLLEKPHPWKGSSDFQWDLREAIKTLADKYPSEVDRPWE